MTNHDPATCSPAAIDCRHAAKYGYSFLEGLALLQEAEMAGGWPSEESAYVSLHPTCMNGITRLRSQTLLHKVFFAFTKAHKAPSAGVSL